MIEFSLPFPPSVNQMWRNVGHKTLLSKRGRAYRNQCMAAILVQNVPCRHMDGSLYVRITAHPPDRRARDIDNLPKGILDALQHCGVIKNDSCIDRLEVERGPVCRDGDVYVEIGCWAGPLDVVA